MNELPVRKHPRLKNYDYSQNGAYFITFCVKDGHEMLWKDSSVGARIARPPLSNIGVVADNAIKQISVHYPSIIVDKYVIMPNHIHMILTIDNDGRAMRAPTISTVISQMKGYVSKQLGYSIWQKLFHDHIIRSEEDYQQICRYIDENPIKWEDDCYYQRFSPCQLS